MGRSRSLDELAAKARKAADLFQESAEPALRRAATFAKQQSDPEYAAETGGDYKLRNWTPGPTFRARYEFQSATSFKLFPAHPGLDVGFHPHLIGVGRSRRGRGRRAVSTAKAARKGGYLKGAGYGHPVKAPVAHPGAPPRGVFRRVVVRLEHTLPRQYAEERFKAMRRAFD